MTMAILMYNSGRIASFIHVGQAGQKIADDETDDEGDDKAALVGQPQRPADAEFLHIGRRVHGEIGVAAHDPARCS